MACEYCTPGDTSCPVCGAAAAPVDTGRLIELSDKHRRDGGEITELIDTFERVIREMSYRIPDTGRLRALVEQWRGEAVNANIRSVKADRDGGWHKSNYADGEAVAYDACADELDQILTPSEPAQ